MLPNEFSKYLTNSSILKKKYLDEYFFSIIDNKPELKNLLDNMLNAYRKKINLELITILDIDNQKKIFIDFDTSLNEIKSSILQSNIIAMDQLYKFKMIIKNYFIYINILKFNDTPIELISIIIHAIHTFCNLFEYDYNNLQIDICLDKNTRTINFLEIGKKSYNEIFSQLHHTSSGFTVSGVTSRYEKHIIITKIEGIIKLIFHELVHYIGLDNQLLQIDNKFAWSLDGKPLNPSEAYTEYMSIILHSMYMAIHIYSKLNITVYECFIKILNYEIIYSIYLSANILKFLGFKGDTLDQLFNGTNKKIKVPIQICEYVILRTQLLLNLNKVLKIIDNWKINNINVNKIIEHMQINNNFINILKKYIDNISPDSNISYSAFDLKWHIL